MTLRHMKIFVTVYRHSNITRAAEELHLAQPSVSLAVKELEEYYGIRLFERIGRRICPTEAGNEFYSYALHIVSLFEDIEKRIKNWDTLGTIRIGTSITIGTHILPGLIKKYQEAYPSLRVEAMVNNSGNHTNWDQHYYRHPYPAGAYQKISGGLPFSPGRSNGE